jgi:YD repeat-containing protein
MVRRLARTPSPTTAAMPERSSVEGSGTVTKAENSQPKSAIGLPTEVKKRSGRITSWDRTSPGRLKEFILAAAHRRRREDSLPE